LSNIPDDVRVTAKTLQDREWSLRIGGEPVDASAHFEAVDPSTEAVIGRVPDAGPAQVEQAVAAAGAAAGPWAALPLRERARRVRALTDVLIRHREELAVLDALDTGITVAAVRSDIDLAVSSIDMFCDLAAAVQGGTFETPGRLHYSVYEPYGVVARIIPFNHALLFAASRIAAPLVAGNAVLLKPAPTACLAALRFAELADAVLPPGLLTVLTGQSAQLGRAITTHPRIKRIGFTGSERVGRQIQQDAAAAGVKSVSLELGGKNPMIVLDDVDVRQAANAAMASVNYSYSNGQSCGSMSRLLVHEAVYDRFIEEFVPAVEALRLGNALAGDVDMGPVISAERREAVERYITAGRDEGAVLAAGGGRGQQPYGYFIEPTVFVDVQPDMLIAREEIFGPVASVLRVRSDEEAVALANGLPYGLAASVWTSDVSRALQLAKGIDAGYVWINDVVRHYPGMPFAGRRTSGVGEEECLGELYSYLEPKSVNIRYGATL
jgi:2-formylbenzoate dehydrogenase